MSEELNKEIERIVKGMKDNKRSLVKRYGNDAEKILYATATKRAKSNLNMKENKLYMGDKGDKVYINISGTHYTKTLPNGDKEKIPTPEKTLYHLINVDNFNQIDMFFDSEEEARKYTNNRGIVVVPKPLPSSIFEHKLKTIIKRVLQEKKEVVDSKSYIKSLNEDVRTASDSEFKIATEFAKSQNGELSGIGVDKKTGNINIAIQFKNETDETDFILDKSGKIIK